MDLSMWPHPGGGHMDKSINDLPNAIQIEFPSAPRNSSYSIPFYPPAASKAHAAARAPSRSRLKADRELSSSQSSRPAVLSRCTELPVFWSMTPNFSPK